MKVNKKFLAYIMVFIFMFSILFSFIYLNECKNHICSNPNTCPICYMIQSSKTLLSQLKEVVPMLGFLMPIMMIFLLKIYHQSLNVIVRTLISQKIELLD